MEKERSGNTGEPAGRERNGVMQEVTLRFGAPQLNDYRTKEAYKTLRTNIAG